MISFRYHLVSIIAVFLALALGIVVGTTALSGPITKDLRSQVNDTKKQRDDLARQVKTLQDQVADAGQFAGTYGAKLVANQLPNAKVLEVVLPGVTAAMQAGVNRQLTVAGASVSSVTVTKDYLDSSRGTGILSLATGASRPNGWTAPETSDPGQIGGSLLSYVLLGKGSPTDITQVLGAFSELHMVSVSGTSVTPSTMVVVIARGKPATSYAGSAELALVNAMANNPGHVIVAGDATSAASGGLVYLVRQSTAARGLITTVDNADTAFGQVASPLALASTSTGTVGQYGTENGADALFPAPPK